MSVAVRVAFIHMTAAVKNIILQSWLIFLRQRLKLEEMLPHKTSFKDGRQIRAKNGMPFNVRVESIVAVCQKMRFLGSYYPIVCSRESMIITL